MSGNQDPVLKGGQHVYVQQKDLQLLPTLFHTEVRTDLHHSAKNIVRIHADLQGPADTTEFSQTHYYIQGLRTVMFHLQRQKSIERTFSFKHVQHEQTVTHIFYKLVSCFHRTKTINEIRFSAFYVIARSISTCTYTLTSREGKESRETSARQCTIGVF